MDQERLHFTLVGLFAGFTIAASCARAAPGSPEGKQAFSKIAKFKLQAFPKRTNPLLNPYERTAFPQFSKALDQERLHFTLVGLFAGFTIAASCARAAPGSPEGKQAFAKIAKFKLQAFPKRTNPLLNPYERTAFPQFSKALDQERLHFTLVGLFAGFTIAASCARAAPGSPEGKQAFSKIAKFKLQAFPKRTNPLLNPY